MSVLPQTPFSRFLFRARTVETPDALAAAWTEKSVTFRLHGGGDLCRGDLGAHLRRSFLGALAPDASPEARAGKPCPRDPPCALDVFRREQFRDARGNGLPKPYVIFAEAAGADLLVSLRVFGAANDWFGAASDAFLRGMETILPWRKVCGAQMPQVSSRRMVMLEGLPQYADGRRAVLEFLSPVDATGRRNGALERSLVSGLIRRANGLARWHGLQMSDNCTRTLTAIAGALDFSGSDLRASAYHSPNSARQKRRHDTVTGRLRLAGPIGPLLPILAIGERGHMGRAAREGLGRYRLIISG